MARGHGAITRSSARACDRTGERTPIDIIRRREAKQFQHSGANVEHVAPVKLCPSRNGPWITHIVECGV